MKLDLDYFKQVLISNRSKLESVLETGEAAAEIVSLDQTRMGRLSRMDAMQQQAMSKANNQRRQLKLQQITAALKRIENYSPTARYCIQCAEEMET